MNTNQFDNIFKEGVYHHEEVAPDLMPKIFERRTAWYVFMNRLSINRFKLAGVLVVGVLAILLSWTITNNQSAKQDLLTSNTSNAPQHVASSNQDERPEAAQSEETSDNSKTKSDDEHVVLNDNVSTPKNQSKKPVAKTSSNTNDVSKSSGKDVTPKIKEVKQSIEPNIPIVVDSVSNPAKPNEDNKVTKSTEKPSETEKSEKTNQVVVKTSDETQKPASIEVDKELDKSHFEDMPKSNPPLKKWSMIVSYGPTYAYRNLDNSKSPEIVALRNQSEKAKYSHQASILANFEITPGFEIYSGVSVLQRREQMEYLKTTKYTDTKIQSHEVIEYHPVLPPKKITVYDTTYQQMQVSSNESRQNSYTHVSVPLGFRLTGYYGPKLGFHVGLDGALQIASINKGSILENEMEELSLSGSTFKRTQFGFSTSATSGMSFLISNRWTAVTEYRFTYFLTPTNGSRYDINQYDIGHGALIGLKYRF